MYTYLAKDRKNISAPTGIEPMIRSCPVGDYNFFFVPRSCHVDQFTFQKIYY